MYDDGMDKGQELDFSDFVNLPLDATHEYSSQNQQNSNEIFYSPAVAPSTGSCEPTPLMSPGSQELNNAEFTIPPSYFSPALSPLFGANGVPDFELPSSSTPGNQRKGIVNGRVSKQVGRRKYNGISRQGSVSTPTSSRHNSSVSPQSNEEEDEAAAAAAAATPASLMKVKLASQNTPSDQEVEERLRMAMGSWPPQDVPKLSKDRRFSGASQSSVSSAITPAIRPRPHRSNHNSASASPALAAHQSPAMTPNEAEVASMLASKSNYQNILDGSHVQLGLHFPERLTTDITNKKASHKMAEQERRNRINSAIVELGRLVAPDTPMTSKAATVEAAIAHIKDLHRQVEQLQEQLNQTSTNSR